MRRSITAVILALLPMQAFAQEKISGTDYYVVDQQSWETGEDSGYYEWRGQGVQVPAEGPLGPGPIECRGSGFWGPDGSRREGICVAGADENTRTYSWSRDQGADVGNWTLLSGTGEFAGMGGQGTFTTRPLPGDRQINDWEGELTLPE